MRAVCLLVVAGLVGASAHSAQMRVAAVHDGAGDPPAVDRLIIPCPAFGPPEGLAGQWALVELFAPLPGTDGADLLQTHPEWLLLSSDGHTRLPGAPDYTNPQVRQARLAHLESLLAGKPAGLCVSALPRADWPQKVNIARGYGFSAEAVAQFRASHGRDPAAAGEMSVDRALFVGMRSQGIAELLRSVRRLAPDLPCALAFDERDTLPHSALFAALDVPALIAEGLVDEVFVQAPTPTRLLWLRLQTDEDFPAWVWWSVADEAALRVAAGVTAAVPGAEGIVVCMPGRMPDLRAVVREATEAFAARQAALAALVKDVAEGRLAPVAATRVEGNVDQSTIHGVAQSFTVERPVTVHAVGICASLRGPNPVALPPVQMSIREDAGGKPGDADLATVAISADTFRREPAYQWGYAELDAPIALSPGRTYWLYGRDIQSPDGSYLWRTVGEQYPGGKSWSCRYPYGHFDWAFSILTRKD